MCCRSQGSCGRDVGMSADDNLRDALIEALYETGDMPRNAAENYADIALAVIKDWTVDGGEPE
jgi:hypothetical protein